MDTYLQIKIYTTILWDVSGTIQPVTAQILTIAYSTNMRGRILKYWLSQILIKIVFEKTLSFKQLHFARIT